MSDDKTINCHPRNKFLDSGNCDNSVTIDDYDDNSLNGTGPYDCDGGGLRKCPTTNDECYPWEITDQTGDSCIIEDYIEESLLIGAAEVNVHKLLGVYSQIKLIDENDIGTSFASSQHPNFPSSNAFDIRDTEWRSVELGNDVVKNAYIGYDFGPIRLDNGRLRYGIETYVKKNISTIKIKQGCDSKNRATRLRIERSADGIKWYGSSIVTVPDCDGTVTISFRSTSPTRYWRIRPLEFNGGDEDYWAVKALILSEHEKTDVYNIQDKIFLENRDRKYSKDVIRTKAAYTPVDYQGFLSKMGFNSPYNSEQYLLEFSFQQVIRLLGRPLVIGDILQLPSETYYTPKMQPTLKYLEVTNVAWATGSYTPQWIPTLLRVIAQPAMSSQETQDIFGKLTEDLDHLGTSDINDGIRNKNYQDVHDIDQTIAADANTAVPQRGQDYANVHALSTELKDWINATLPGVDTEKLDRRPPIWAQDALPPNGEDYTVGDDFPNNPSNGDYHRLTYDSIDKTIAPRLYRYSDYKKRWLYLETDARFNVWTGTESTITEFLNDSVDKTDVNKIDDHLNKT